MPCCERRNVAVPGGQFQRNLWMPPHGSGRRHARLCDVFLCRRPFRPVHGAVGSRPGPTKPSCRLGRWARAFSKRRHEWQRKREVRLICSCGDFSSTGSGEHDLGPTTTASPPLQVLSDCPENFPCKGRRVGDALSRDCRNQNGSVGVVFYMSHGPWEARSCILLLRWLLAQASSAGASAEQVSIQPL